MPEVTAASTAEDLGLGDACPVVTSELDPVCFAVGEARPSGAGVELGVGAEQGGVAGRATGADA